MKVLMIEDDKRIADLLRRGLERSSFMVEWAASGAEARAMVADGMFDAILMDVMLPDVSGIELCSELRDLGIDLPILMLTARDSVADKVDGLSAGADDYLTKPFSFEELKARLIALSRRPAAFIDASQLSAGLLTLFPAQSRVTWDGKMVNLTPKEFAVVEILLRNKGQVLSREVLLDRVWGTSYEPSANVVDAVVARIRVKLKQVGKGGSTIHTIRGLGYRIE